MSFTWHVTSLLNHPDYLIGTHAVNYCMFALVMVLYLTRNRQGIWNTVQISIVSAAIRMDYFLTFGLLAPYLERACFLLATPAVSRVPLMMWYLVPGKSLTLPPRIRTTLCS